MNFYKYIFGTLLPFGLLMLFLNYAQANTELGFIDFVKHTYSLNGEDYRITDTTGGMILISKGGKMGFANANGELIQVPQFDLVFPFKTISTVVILNGKYGVISNKGKVILDCEYQKIEPFNCSITSFQKDNKWGLVSSRGKFILAAHYHHIFEVSDDMAVCRTVNNKYILVNASGKTIDTLANDIFSLKNFTENEQLLRSNNFLYISSPILPINLYAFHNGIAIGRKKENEEYCFVNKNNEMLFGKTFLKLRPFVNGFACVKTKKGWNILDLKGDYVLSKWYTFISLANEHIIVGNNQEYGVLDLKGNELIPIKYQKIAMLDNGLFAYCTNGKWGVINDENKVIMQPIYEGIDFDTFTKIGRAGVYVSSFSLNTGIPRYNYVGHYFEFNEKGKVSNEKYPYGMLVEGISDWHSEHFDLSGSHFTFAPKLDEHQYGYTFSNVNHLTSSSIFGPQVNFDYTITDDATGNKITKGKILRAQFFPNCIVVQDEHKNAIIYDLLGKELYKAKNTYISDADNGLFRAYIDGKHIVINAKGEEIEFN